MAGEELVRAEEGVGDSLSKVAEVGNLRRTEVSHKRKRRADEYKERQRVQSEGNALGVQEQERNCKKYKSGRAVDKEAVNLEYRYVGGEMVGDGVVRVVGGLGFGPK